MGDWQKKEPRTAGGFGSARETTESRDITSSQLAEAASRQSEELFRASFAHAAIGLAISDVQGHFLEANPAYCSITGYTQAELRALDFQAITHPDDLPKTMDEVRALLAGEIPAFVREKRLVRKDGNIVWVQNSVSLIRDSQGRPISLVTFSQDISERKRVEQALREAERKYREIFENAGEGIFQTSPEGRTITANPAMARMLGFDSPEELIRERKHRVQKLPLSVWRAMSEVEEHIERGLADEFGHVKGSFTGACGLTTLLTAITANKRRQPPSDRDEKQGQDHQPDINAVGTTVARSGCDAGLANMCFECLAA